MAYFTKFKEDCQRRPASTRERIIIPWHQGRLNYVVDIKEFDTGGKLTPDQLLREVGMLKKCTSWNPVVVYMSAYMGVAVWMLLSIAIPIAAYYGYSAGKHPAYLWPFYVLASLISILFGCVILICSKKHADMLAHTKGVKLSQKLRSVELKYLKGSEMGLRAGRSGAWIEFGHPRFLCSLLIIQQTFIVKLSKQSRQMGP